MSTSTDSPRRPRQRRLVPRNLLSYDERRKLEAPAAASTECARRDCSEPVKDGNVCCALHAEGLARLKAELDQPWDWKDGKRGSRPRRSAESSAPSNP